MRKIFTIYLFFLSCVTFISAESLPKLFGKKRADSIKCILISSQNYSPDMKKLIENLPYDDGEILIEGSSQESVGKFILKG